jgi:hypothetical protein
MTGKGTPGMPVCVSHVAFSNGE